MIKKKQDRRKLVHQTIMATLLPLQITIGMKNAKENICAFFLPLSQTYRELLRYACVNLSILEIDSPVGCDGDLCFKLLNS